jgi:hypothetical protein
LPFAGAVDAFAPGDVSLGGPRQKPGHMLFGEPDCPETKPYALDCSLARPFQDGLFVDMQTGCDGAFVE